MRTVLTSLALAAISLLGFLSAQAATSNNSDPYVVIKASKAKYFTGEVVAVDVIFENQGSEIETLYGLPSQNVGTLSFRISTDNKEYRLYRPAGYSRSDIKELPLELRPGSSLKTSAAILWNDTARSKHLNPQASGELATAYAFPKPGTYFLKASYVSYSAGIPKFVDSEPIAITVEEPLGEDLEVWNRIKNDGNFAYFIQEGDLQAQVYEPNLRDAFQKEVEAILQKYPTSIYAAPLRRSLKEFKSRKIRRNQN